LARTRYGAAAAGTPLDNGPPLLYTRPINSKQDAEIPRGWTTHAHATAGAFAMNIIAQLEQEQIAKLNKTIPDFRPGDSFTVNL
jgi:hypothetical protein